ncbi:hypothetical protein MUP77_23365 [Candidatus Bathyarchaeota archaeon]|nr:hypothetical protein [Candidatus Bathyarchaeota archaeon]
MMEWIPEFIRKFFREKYEACWVPFENLCKASPRPWPWVLAMLLCVIALILPIGQIVYILTSPGPWYFFFFKKSFWVPVIFVFIVVVMTVSACWRECEMRFKEIINKDQSRYKEFIQCRNRYTIKEVLLQNELARCISKQEIDTTSKIERQTGLQQFSTWILKSIDTMKSKKWTDCQLHLAMNTPLLHSFYWSGKPDGRCMKEYTTVDHTNLDLKTLKKEQLDKLNWSGFFCGPLVNQIDEYTFDTLDFHFLSLHPVWLRQSTRWFPFQKREHFDIYKKEIENFKNSVAGALNTNVSDVDTLFQETDMLPFWIAVIRGKANGDNVGEVVLALTGSEDLRKVTKLENGRSVDQMESIDDFKNFARGIADNVIVLKSNDANIVNFFDHVFNNLILRDYDMVRLFRELLREGQHQGLDMMFRVAYDTLHHANIDHKHNIKYVVYSTEKKSK